MFFHYFIFLYPAFRHLAFFRAVQKTASGFPLVHRVRVVCISFYFAFSHLPPPVLRDGHERIISYAAAKNKKETKQYCAAFTCGNRRRTVPPRLLYLRSPRLYSLRRVNLAGDPLGGFTDNLNLADFIFQLQILLLQLAFLDSFGGAFLFPLGNRRQFLEVVSALQNVLQIPLCGVIQRDFCAAARSA
jgi:hypothetical protein